MNKKIPTFTNEEEKRILKKLNPKSGRACNDNFMWGTGNNQEYSGNYYGFSFKRSKLNNVKFRESTFDHCNFTGSILERVIFDNNCKFSSVNFLRSIFKSCTFNSEETMHGINFSSSTLDQVDFSNVQLRGSYFNNAKILNSTFLNCCIRSTSFDNCIFKECLFQNCNMKNLNLEFSTFLNVKLINSQISYYQLPYIIGIFKNLENLVSLNIGYGDNKTMSFEEYKTNIRDSIIYFSSKQQFFPLINLYFLDNKSEIARKCIFIGVEDALLKNDYVLIKYIIKLSLILELLNWSEVNEILTQIDNHLSKNKEDINYPYYLLQSFEIQQEIQNILGKSVLNLKIDTILSNSEYTKASELCQEIDDIIIQSKVDVKHSFNLSHNSPLAIVLTVIGCVADLMTITSFVSRLLEKKLKKNKCLPIEIRDSLDKHNKLFLNSIDDKVKNLKTILDKSAKKEHSQIIENFRIKLLADIDENIDINLSLISTQNSKE